MTKTLVATTFAACSLFAASAFAAPSSDSMAASADNGNARITKAEAKADIVSDNYTDVTDLQHTSKGWTAKAKDLGSSVSLLVTHSGDVNQT